MMKKCFELLNLLFVPMLCFIECCERFNTCLYTKLPSVLRTMDCNLSFCFNPFNNQQVKRFYFYFYLSNATQVFLIVASYIEICLEHTVLENIASTLNYLI